MSHFKKIQLISALALITFLTGCKKDDTPSTALVEESLRNQINSFGLYSHDKASLQSWERINGWKDNENYVVEVTANLTHNTNYLNLLADCTEEAESYIGGNETLAFTSLTPTVYLSSQVGVAESLYAFIQEKKDTGKHWPHQKLEQLEQKLGGSTNLSPYLIYCDYTLLTEYETFLSRELEIGDNSTVNYQLYFRPTEKGWQAF